MPTCALSVVYDTSRKTGAPVGNVPWIPTCATMPLTEIATVGDDAGVVRCRRSGRNDRSALLSSEVVLVGVVVVGRRARRGGRHVGARLVRGRSPCGRDQPTVVACGVKGFFVAKTLKTTS